MQQLHHIIPRHTCQDKSCLGYKNNNRKHTCGIDHPSNLYSLNHTQHALAHRNRAILTGNAHDWLTWKMMSGQMGKEEVRQEAWKIGYKNRDTSYLQDPAYQEKQRQGSIQRGAKPPSWKGKHHKVEVRERISSSQKGNQYVLGMHWNWSEDSRKKRSEKYTGMRWITNDQVTKRLFPNDPMPDGFRRGRK